MTCSAGTAADSKNLKCDELFLVPCSYGLTWTAQPGSPVTVESQLDQEHVAEPNFDEPT